MYDQVYRLTFILYSPFHALLTCTSKGMSTHQLEVFGHFVHLLSFQVGHNDENLVAARVVHAPQ